MKQAWIQYRWKHEGMPSITKADKDIALTTQFCARFPMLMIVQLHMKEPRIFKRKRKAGITEKYFEKIALKLNKGLTERMGVIVACRLIGDETIFIYIYCLDENSHTIINQMAHKNNLICSASYFEDPHWEMFQKELRPNMAQNQTIQNIEAIALRQKKGDDIYRPRKVNHYCAFIEEIQRIEFQAQALQTGFALGNTYYLPEQQQANGVCVCKISAIDVQGMNEMTTRLCGIAGDCGGIYQYWDCKLTPK